MPRSSWGQVDTMQLRHKILLLELLNNRLEGPSTTAINEERRESFSATERDHGLGFQREKQLAEAFAFLAATTKDSKRVIAACVKEHIDKRRGLTIQLSVNRGELDCVKDGFEKMAKILEHAAQEGAVSGISDSMPQAHDSLLHTAIELNQNRILMRLRSRHANFNKCNFTKYKLHRPKIVLQLYGAIVANKHLTAQSIQGRPVVTEGNLQVLRDDVEKLRMLFERLECLPTTGAQCADLQHILLELVGLCHTIHHSEILERTLNACLDLAPPSKILIPIAITKIGHYVTVCEMLLRSAHQYSLLFSHIQVEVVTVGPPMPTEVDLDKSTACAIDRLLQRDLPPETVRALNPKLTSTQSLAAWIPGYLRQQATVAVPVHAEIQLLFYYETEAGPDDVPPRIIYSSKQACFLCNLFFQIHGKYVVPSTHGKLYEKWTLPNIDHDPAIVVNSPILTTLKNFAAAIDKIIAKEVQSPRKPLPNPGESMIIFSPTGSGIYSKSLIGMDTTIQPPDPHSCTAPEVLRVPSIASGTAAASREIFRGPQVRTETETASPNSNSSRHSLPITSAPDRTQPSSTTSFSPPIIGGSYTPLERGHPIRCKLCPVLSQKESSVVRVSTPKIHLTISYEYSEYMLAPKGLNNPDVESCNYWVIIEYLPLQSVSDAKSAEWDDGNVDPDSQPVNGTVFQTVRVDDKFETTTLDYSKMEFPKTLYVHNKNDSVAITYFLHEPVK